jgi:hypothetical protein
VGSLINHLKLDWIHFVCACVGLKLPQCQVKPYKQKQQLLLRDLLPVAGVAIYMLMFGVVRTLSVQAENNSG